ncbi:MAG TPA: AmmeMemoRadiSam system protein A [Vicinamibacterales bacterium]|nr:AmmeMemoRadiSam system protein A [Vicinamibacterales bacterium]
MIPESARAELLALARRAIRAALTEGPHPVPPASGDLARHAAAFVTLHVNGKLRGCIGHIVADRSLADVVASCAVAAAGSDPRFPPVGPNEAPDLEVEISVLGAFEPVHAIADVEVGRHGLLVESGNQRGLLLPQVAPEWGWSAAAFIGHTCQKAGLPRDAWPSGRARLYRFEAEVFGDGRLPPTDAADH